MRSPRGRALDRYFVRRVVAVVVLLALIAGVVALVRALAGGGGDAEVRAEPVATVGQVPPAAPTDLAARVARAGVPVLCYHQIRPLEAGGDAAYVTTPAQLEAHLEALAKAGYRTITAGQYADHVRRGTVLPPKPIVLTFDDASEGHYTEAMPLLERYGMTATFFIMTVVLGNDGWMTRDQVAEADAAGIEIGAHTWDHHAVTELRTPADYRVQLRQPRGLLQQIVGHPVTTFAYPFGITSPRVIAPLQQAGYTSAFQLASRSNPRAPVFTLRRVAVGAISPDSLLDLIGREFPDAPGGDIEPVATTTVTTTTPVS